MQRSDAVTATDPADPARTEPRPERPAVPSLVVAGSDAGSPPQLRSASDGLRQPVFLPGIAAEAAAKELWSVDQLLALAPDASVAVEHYADGDRRKPFELQTRTFGELVGPMRDDPTRWFIAATDFDDTFPAVSHELEHLRVVPPDARARTRSVFLGSDTQSALHFHVKDQAILVQLHGRKRMILSGPDTTDRLATNSRFGRRPNYSTCGPEPGSDALDALDAVLGRENVRYVDLEPGDAIFIPVHWWHWAEGHGESFSVTTFWRAAWRDWSFPQPGYRAAAAVAVAEVVALARRMGSLLPQR